MEVGVGGGPRAAAEASTANINTLQLGLCWPLVGLSGPPGKRKAEAVRPFKGPASCSFKLGPIVGLFSVLCDVCTVSGGGVGCLTTLVASLLCQELSVRTIRNTSKFTQFWSYYHRTFCIYIYIYMLTEIYSES